jgi:hypothetical protein
MNILAKALVGGWFALAIGVPSADAGILGAGTYLKSFALSLIEKPVPLRQNAATAVPFATKVANTFVVVTYSAQCGVRRDEFTGSVSIRIEVDGIAALPQAGFDFALCTAVSDPQQMPSLRASRQAVIKVPSAGKHNVRVFASLQYATQGYLADGSIVIHD